MLSCLCNVISDTLLIQCNENTFLPQIGNDFKHEIGTNCISSKTKQATDMVNFPITE